MNSSQFPSTLQSAHSGNQHFNVPSPTVISTLHKETMPHIFSTMPRIFLHHAAHFWHHAAHRWHHAAHFWHHARHLSRLFFHNNFITIILMQ
jgi:hypothetical protein